MALGKTTIAEAAWINANGIIIYVMYAISIARANFATENICK